MHSQRLEGGMDLLEIPYGFWESAAFSSEQGNNGHCRFFFNALSFTNKSIQQMRP